MSASPSSDLKGHALLSSLYASCRDTATFKLFRSAHLDNLNILEADLLFIETQYNKSRIAHENALQPGDLSPTTSARALLDSADGPLSTGTLFKLRGKALKRYAKAKLLFREIDKLPPVNPRVFAGLKEWYKGEEGGKYFRHGIEDRIWDDVADLTAICRSDNVADGILFGIQDLLVSLISGFLRKDNSKQGSLPLWESPIPSEPWHMTATWYPENKVINLINIISTVVASILPSMSILALLFVQSQAKRVGIILVQTLVFSLATALFGRGRGTDPFAISAAISAVLVVYAQGTTPGH